MNGAPQALAPAAEAAGAKNDPGTPEAAPSPASRPEAVSVAQGIAGSYEDYRDALLHSWASVVTALGCVLIPLFLVLDRFTMPEALQARFLDYRLVTTGMLAVQWIVLRRTRPSRLSYLHGYFLTVVVGTMIVMMTVDLGGFDSSYYAGLILVMVGVTLMLPWRAVHSAINGLILLLLYAGANAAWGGPFQRSTLINNLYFLVAMVVIAVAISYTKHRLISQEFHLRAELVAVNERLDHSSRDLAAARDALWGEMEVAKRIQTALLPKDRRLGPYAVCAHMQPADEVGGDYYDLIETRFGEHWLAIGDVSGHGVESGLVMMMTQTSILTTVNEVAGLSPSEVFARVNAVVMENISRLETNRYMTLNVVRLLPEGLCFSGKHQDVLVRRAKTGQVESVSNDGAWIGVVPDARGFVDDLRLELSPGDTALFFTDGVTEATSHSGEMFGDERLGALLQRVGERPLPEILEAIRDEVARFAASQEDDITLLLLRREFD